MKPRKLRDYKRVFSKITLIAVFSLFSIIRIEYYRRTKKAARAFRNDVVLAETGKYEIVESNIYFPPESVKWQYFKKSDTEYTCPWKGKAVYYDIVLEDKVIKDGAWGYPEPKEAAENIKGRVAFSYGEVKVRTESSA